MAAELTREQIGRAVRRVGAECRLSPYHPLTAELLVLIDASQRLLAMKPASDEEMRVHMSSRGVASWALDTDNWPSVAAAYRACERRLLPFDDEYEE